MRQILIRIPIPGTDYAQPLYGYGAMLCLAFLAAIWVAARRARRCGQPVEIIYNAALFCFVGGVLGARVFYVVQFHEHFNSWLDLFKIWEGGLTYYGGLLMATAATMGYLVMARLPVLYWLDIMAPSLALGLAFGRMGCFLNGCCFGAECPHEVWGLTWPAGSIPWFHYANEYLAAQGGLAGSGAPYGATVGALAATWQPPAIYPSQILALAGGLLLFAVLHFMFRHKRRHGQILLAFFLLYGLGRFLEEALRADEASIYLLGLPTLLDLMGHPAAAAGLHGLTISQNVAIVMVIGAAVALVYLLKSPRRGWNADYVPPAPVLSDAAPAAGPSRKKPPKPRKGKNR